MSNRSSSADHPHPFVRRMEGRDPGEKHRVATPLELLFDLTFATSFALAAAQFAHAQAAAHYGSALFGFGFAALAICWAWVNFSWFASAYDTDDWAFRLATMVQMAGVLILAIGLPPMFESVQHAEHMNVSIMVLGYVVMRVAMVFQWLRAASQNPARRRACLTYAITIFLAQLGWVTLILLDKTPIEGAAIGMVLWLVEFAAPALAERKDGGTPWHAHHIAERYGLFAIIALGEGIAGTVAAISAVIERQGWTMDAALVCIAGTGLTFGVWWMYSLLPSARALHLQRSRAFIWGYAQMLIVTSIVAIGAGLHVAALYVEGGAEISASACVLSVAIPASLFMGLVHGLHHYLTRRTELRLAWLLASTAILAIAVIAACLGLDMAACLVILMLAPAITVVGHELLGHPTNNRRLAG